MIDEKDIEKLSNVFATKDDLDNLENNIEGKIVEFKDEILIGQDEILKELKALRQEQTVGDAQDKRQKRVLEIHNDALKNGKILSGQQATEIDGLRVF